ncbi:hypothetical protein [Achromobacter xylosoxidans]|uniref:hypothetical protein n=1 Tax=Alcaligenes xylosoxydans xylosoxydans TaxID=85698 RepID=UPI003D014486
MSHIQLRQRTETSLSRKLKEKKHILASESVPHITITPETDPDSIPRDELMPYRAEATYYLPGHKVGKPNEDVVVYHVVVRWRAFKKDYEYFVSDIRVNDRSIYA